MSDFGYNYKAYASFYFGCSEMADTLDDDMASELACTFHEEQIYLNGTLFESAAERAKELADRAGFENVTVEKGEGTEGPTVRLFQDGQFLAAFDVDVYVDDEDMEKTLPDGSTAAGLMYFGWGEWEAFERQGR